MFQLDPNGTQQENSQQNWSSEFSEQGRTNGQVDKWTNPNRTGFPGSDVGLDTARIR